MNVEVPVTCRLKEEPNQNRKTNEETVLPSTVVSSSSSSSDRSSPDANCPICLERLLNKSFTDSCLHQFCFNCLLQWSKVKAECPLCKQSFKSIIHNVRSIEDYEQYYLSNSVAPADDGVLEALRYHPYNPYRPREPFRYRTTNVSSYLDYFVRLEEAFSNFVIPPGVPQWPRRRHNGTSEFRRNVYQQGLWVQRTRDVTGRVRDCSPEFYRANPALTHRLVPWLNRELNVLCNQNEPHVQFVMNDILGLIKYTPIRSPRFAEAVAPYFGRHTEHFVHEFYSFASSPYDLSAYDRHANYVGQEALAHEFSDGHDSDVEVLPMQPSPMPSIHLEDSDSDDCVVVDHVPCPHPPPVITLESSDTEDEVVQVNIHIDHNRPGPSRIASKRKSCEVKNVQSKDVSVSIQLGCSSHPRSPSGDSTDSSSSLWMPTTSKKMSTKRKKKTCNKSTTQNKFPKKKSKASKNRDALPSKKRRPPVIDFSSDELSNDDSNKLDIVTDYQSSSSSEHKPRLRSVVVKNEVKSEPHQVDPEIDSDSVESIPSGSYWNSFTGESVRGCGVDDRRRKRYSSTTTSSSLKEYRYYYKSKLNKKSKRYNRHDD